VSRQCDSWHAHAQMQFAIDTFAFEYLAYHRCIMKALDVKIAL
jgi:hypothetical protein